MKKDGLTLSEFISLRPVISFRRGQIVIRPEDAPLNAYYIEKGSVKIYSITESGDENVHIIYTVGEIFPLIWIVNHISKNVYYEALEPSILRKIAKTEFLEFLKGNNDVLFELTKRLAASFSVFVDRVDNLEITNSYPRLIARLLNLAKRFGETAGKKVIIRVPVTHKDIANSINMSRETASREFEKLSKKGLIGMDAHLIVIYDIDALKKEFSRYYERRPV